MPGTVQTVIDWGRFSEVRQTLGQRFVRTISYFCEDGTRSLAAIENGIRAQRAIDIVGPAELLKVEAMQIGAITVAELAEDIEFAARDSVEWRQAPTELVEPLLDLRSAFDETVTLLDREVNPLARRAV